MRKPISTDILKRYLENTCTPDEKESVWEWYESLNNADDFVSRLDKHSESDLEEKIYANILNRIQQSEVRSPALITKRNRNINYMYTTAAVAAMVVICFFCVFNYNYHNKQLPDPLRAARKLRILTVKNTTKRIYKCALPDSSIVWLSPGAEIKYPEKFATKFRMISFSGESFFEITKNPKRPFIINSSTVVTKVWGTSFRIRDLPDHQSTDVSVVTGKVSVSRKNTAHLISAELEKQEVILYPNQNIKLYNGRQPLKAETIQDRSTLKLWDRISLSFDNASIKNIVPLLNDKFNVHVVISDEKLNNYVLNADFTEFNLPEILQALKKTLGIDYEIDGTNIKLK